MHYVTLFKKNQPPPPWKILPFFWKNSFFSICLITPKRKILLSTKSILVSLSYLIKYNLVGLIEINKNIEKSKQKQLLLYQLS